MVPSCALFELIRKGDKKNTKIEKEKIGIKERASYILVCFLVHLVRVHSRVFGQRQDVLFSSLPRRSFSGFPPSAKICIQLCA